MSYIFQIKFYEPYKEVMLRHVYSYLVYNINFPLFPGDDWSSGDKDGGPGNIGVIIRKRQDGKVKVRRPLYEHCLFDIN